MLLRLRNPAEDSGMDVKTRTEAARRYPTPALEKGLDALELLASESQGLTKTEVARRLGRTVSEVFRMLVSGASLTGIAERLNLSIKTISTHKARLMQKLGVANSSELFRYAMEHRLTDDATSA